jgi:hypothetical protein
MSIINIILDLYIILNSGCGKFNLALKQTSLLWDSGSSSHVLRHRHQVTSKYVRDCPTHLHSPSVNEQSVSASRLSTVLPHK